MGLFGLFGNKKKEKKQNQDHDIMNREGLVDFVKSNLDDPSEENVLKAVQAIAKPANYLEHLDPDGGLPWGWHTANSKFTDKIRAEYNSFFRKWLGSRNANPATQYAEIKSFVLYMQDVKKLCASKGECFNYWRDELFTDEYLEARTKEMEYIESNIDQLEAEYKKRKSELKNLDERIENALKEHDGILQSDFVKLFDSTVRTEVRDKLYNMTQAGQLERTKSGRSYILHIIKKA